MEFLNQYWLTSHSLEGVLHFSSSILGLILGLGILFLKPGSKIHKLSGYVFIPTLVIVNISALFIHELGVRFGPFHYIIPFSLFYLGRGVYPFIFNVEKSKRLKMHIKGMVGASLGLWAAFFAEFVARTPDIKNFFFPSSGNSFWISTLVGFFFVFLFMYIISKINKIQLKRVGIE